ncbi:MAG TPA: carbon storage regulator [Gammaproteobacteria bacterium]|nr:carbon storage regulator [Gammaproteobacteria bacterium]
MLVLSRRPGEQLHIGTDIIVEVLDISGTQVRLGISAPREVPVLRDELLDEQPGWPDPDLVRRALRAAGEGA